MDSNVQKKIVSDYLENAYSGAKMVNDEEMMLRIGRAITTFNADVNKDIFIEENVLDFSVNI